MHKLFQRAASVLFAMSKFSPEPAFTWNNNEPWA